MNYRYGMFTLVGILLLILTYCIGYTIGSQKRPVYNRVYTSDHKSIERALHKAHVDITNEQLEDMYRNLKDEH